MKIVHVLYSGLGGHSNVFFSMVKADDINTFEYEAIFNGIEDIRQDYIINCNANRIRWSFLKKKPGKHFSFLWQMAKAIRASKADIIFLHGSVHAISAWIATMFSGKKQKIIVRETQANNLKTKKEWVALKIAMLLVDKVVFLSNEYIKEVENKLGWYYNNKKSIVIPNGLDLTTYYPAGSSSKIEAIVIGMQSRLVPIKDHATLLKAFAAVKATMPGKVTLQIAGDGECRTSLEKLSASLHLENDVFFTGMLNEKELVQFLQSLDIYVHASLGETMSTAIMQAMACRLPIIASDVPGINNMIEHQQNGILIPVYNDIKLTESIMLLINNPDIATRLSTAGYNFAVQNYSNVKMFDSYKSVFAD